MVKSRTIDPPDPDDSQALDSEDAPTAGETDFTDERPTIDPGAHEAQDRAAFESAREVGGYAAEIRADEDADERRALDVLQTMRDLEHADEVEWRISRFGADEPSLNGYLEAWPSSLMTLERLRDKFGGGKYRLHGMRRGRYYAHKVVTIAGDAIRRNKPRAAVEPNQNASGDFKEFLLQQQQMDERRRRDEEAREERRRREEREREDRRFQNMTGLVTAIGSALAPVIGGFLQRRDSTAELVAALKPERVNPLELLQLMREMREQEGPRQPAPDVIDKAIQLAEKFAGAGSGGEISIWEIVREAVKSVGPGVGAAIQTFAEQAATAKALQAAQAAQALQAQARPALEAPRPAQAPRDSAAAQGSPPMRQSTIPSATAPGSSVAASSRAPAQASADTAASRSSSAPIIDSGDADMLKLLPLLSWLKAETERLIVAASRGSDPELRAAAMFDDLPDSADLEAIGAVLARADWFTLFTALDSRVAQYEPWFAEVRRALLELIAEETGVYHGARQAAGVDAASGREKVIVSGPGQARPAGEVERPGPPPPLTGIAEESGEIE